MDDGGGYQASYLHTDVPHPARLYNLYLGGKDYYEADREAADRNLKVFPNLPIMARQNRLFLGRAVRYLAQEAGIRQFLDVGTGIPSANNTHEVAQEINPEARVVYVDNDPIVLTHARALLRSKPSGRTGYVDADLRAPEAILRAPEVRDILDFGEPIALMLIAILHFIPDEDQPYSIVERLLNALPPGSYLALSHVTPDFVPDDIGALVEQYRKSGIPAQARSLQEVERFFEGLELLPPGVQLVSTWRQASPDAAATDEAVSCYGAIARKPGRE